jgi:hypothetical protein
MVGMAKVENFGLEDAFKKAQQGAGFDPAKLAENERKQLMMASNEYLRVIAGNTVKRPVAGAVN